MIQHSLSPYSILLIFQRHKIIKDVSEQIFFLKFKPDNITIAKRNVRRDDVNSNHEKMVWGGFHKGYKGFIFYL